MAHLCLVAGDPSGDARAAELVQALKRRRPSMTFAGLGGARMQDAGVTLWDDLTRASSIGPIDALRHLGRFVRAKRLLHTRLRQAPPDAVILVDFGDFNLPIVAPIAKRAGCRVLYYVSPQLWAWGQFRLRLVKQYVDRMLVLFPFEEEWYRRHGVPVTWVGHPLADTPAPSRTRERVLQDLGLNPSRMTVGLLPGSRAKEISRHVPLLAATAKRLSWDMPGVQFLLLKSPGIPDACYRDLFAPGLAVVPSHGPLSEVMHAADAAVVASGTATLETALAGVPLVVVYRTSWLTYLAAKAVLRVPHIALVNVLAGDEVAPEFLQHHAQPGRIAHELSELLRKESRRTDIRRRLQAVKERLGPPGAADRAADAVLDCVGP